MCSALLHIPKLLKAPEKLKCYRNLLMVYDVAKEAVIHVDWHWAGIVETARREKIWREECSLQQWRCIRCTRSVFRIVELKSGNCIGTVSVNTIHVRRRSNWRIITMKLGEHRRCSGKRFLLCSCTGWYYAWNGFPLAVASERETVETWGAKIVWDTGPGET